MEGSSVIAGPHNHCWQVHASHGCQMVCRSFDTIEEGAQYCEERLLAVAVAHDLCRPPGKRMTLEETLQTHADLQKVRPSLLLVEPRYDDSLGPSLLAGAPFAAHWAPHCLLEL